MHFSRLVALLFAASLAGLTAASPVPRSVDSDLALRSDDNELFERKLSPVQVGKKANQIIQKQAAKKQNKQTNRGNKPTKAQRTAVHDSKKKTTAQKQATKQAQTARRTANRAQGRPKGPARTAPKPKTRPNPADKKQVKKALKNAGARMKATQNIPGRHDTFQRGAVSRTGKDARKAVMNTYLHKPAPVGGQGGAPGVPKQFMNHPYPQNHGNAALRGTRPLANPGGRRLMEYPVKSGSGTGYIGNGDKGKVRAVTSSNNGQDRFHGLLTHDANAGGGAGAHYPMTHTAAQPTDWANNV